MIVPMPDALDNVAIMSPYVSFDFIIYCKRYNYFTGMKGLRQRKRLFRMNQGLLQGWNARCCQVCDKKAGTKILL
jgi:hypothetical protein